MPMPSDNDAEFMALKKDVEHLMNQSVLREDMTRTIVELKESQIIPIREEQIRQRNTMEVLASEMSNVARSNEETNKTVKDVLKTYHENLLAAKDAEIAKAKSESFWAFMTTKVFVFVGGLIGLGTLGSLLYGIIKWIATHP